MKKESTCWLLRILAAMLGAYGLYAFRRGALEIIYFCADAVCGRSEFTATK